MRLSRHVFLLLFVLIALVAVGRAQNDEPNDTPDNTPAPTQPDEPATTGDDEPASTGDDEPATTGDDAPVTSVPLDDEEPENTSGGNRPTASTADDEESDTATSTDASQTDAVTSAPTRTTDVGGGGAAITGAPSLINVIPIYPAASIPPTADAPFMQRSDLPQGTVFICVGAVLAFAILLVITWRGMVAYSIRRSIKRANTHGYLNPAKEYNTGGVGGMVKPFYAQGMGSSLSLDPLTGATKGSGKTARGSFMPQSSSSLFFSPTAGANVHSNGNRASGYLPAGYYAAGASAAGNGIAGNGRPVSIADFTNNRPQSSGYQRARNYDNLDSPSLHPSHATDASYGRLAPAAMSSTSLTGKSDGKAPSTFLDDLFDYPPVPQHGQDRR